MGETGPGVRQGRGWGEASGGRRETNTETCLYVFPVESEASTRPMSSLHCLPFPHFLPRFQSFQIKTSSELKSSVDWDTETLVWVRWKQVDEGEDDEGKEKVR